MAAYTPGQLRGQGTLTEVLTGQKTFTFSEPGSGSGYFTLEAVRNVDGAYDSTSAVTKGTFAAYSNLNPSQTVESNYIWSVVIPQGGGVVKFTPGATISANAAYLRGTGEFSLTIS